MVNRSRDAEVQRILVKTASFGPDLCVARDWAVKAIFAVGNYGEIFQRHIGKNTPLRLNRGLNQLWSRGGLLYAPPFR